MTRPRARREPTARTDGPERPGAPTPEDERARAEEKAWDSLARYKFYMFGYWCATWVQMNRLCTKRAENPWCQIVALARQRAGHRHEPPGRRTR